MNTAQKSKISEYDQLKQRIHQKLIGKLDLTRVGDLEGDVLRREIRVVVEHLCDAENTLLNRSERDRLVDEVSGRNIWTGSTGIAAQGSDDQRYSDQRSEKHLLRKRRQDGKDQRRISRQRALAADH